MRKRVKDRRSSIDELVKKFNLDASYLLICRKKTSGCVGNERCQVDCYNTKKRRDY